MEIAKDLKILLVDDNRVNQRLAIFSFAQIGVKCDIAFDGKDAFEKYQLTEYDLIFMDVQMPVMDGLESTKLIRLYEKESGRLHCARIVALTGSESVENKAACLEAGMDDFVEKPIRVDWLSKYFSEFCDNIEHPISNV